MPKASRARQRKSNQSSQERQAPLPATQPVRPRLQRKEMSNRTRIAALILGDSVCFLIFVTLGSDAHGEGVNLLYSLWLALPFIAAWFLISPFVGAYRADIATRPRQMLLRTALSWLAVWPVAMLFRWLLVERLEVPPVSLSSFLSFALVVLIFNLVLLSFFWRWPFALNNELRKRGI